MDWPRSSVLVLVGLTVGASWDCGASSPTRPTTSSQPISSPQPPAPQPPEPTGPGIVTVEVSDFSDWPPRGCGLCVPQLPERVSLDGTRVRSFDNSGVLRWEGVADGVHTLRILSGDYGGPVICGFWFNLASNEWKQTTEIVVENGQSTPVTIRFDCT
jgi:hypothetical protein